MENKEKINSEKYIKLFMDLFLIFVGLSPYFLVAMVLMNIKTELGIRVFYSIFYFVKFPIGAIILIIIFDKKIPVISKLKEFIAYNSKIIFLMGVAVFYLLIIVSIILNLDNIIPGVMMGIFSLFFFPFSFLLLILGRRILKKKEENQGKALSLNDILSNS